MWMAIENKQAVTQEGFELEWSPEKLFLLDLPLKL